MMLTATTDELLTVDQLAKRLQVAPVTVRLWTRQGDIPVTRCNRLLRFRYADVMAAFEGEQRGGRDGQGRAAQRRGRSRT